MRRDKNELEIVMSRALPENTKTKLAANMDLCHGHKISGFVENVKFNL